MIKNISIRNYKTIEKLDIELGRVTVLIGENGAGKSNILEAITLAGAACAKKLDNEFLQSRGVRTSRSRLMRSAFLSSPEKELSSIEISVESESKSKAEVSLANDNKPYSKWEGKVLYSAEGESDLSLVEVINDMLFTNRLPDVEQSMKITETLKYLLQVMEDMESIKDDGARAEYLSEKVGGRIGPGDAFFDHFKNNRERFSDVGLPLSGFITYSPENSSLRNDEYSTNIEPLSTNGGGLLKLIHTVSEFEDDIGLIKSNLQLLGWFSDFTVKSESSGYALEIQDSYLDDPSCVLDQNSANEGFMFLLFYFTLFVTPIGPTFFAIDNIDTSLNPKLCQKLIQQLIRIAKLKGKQVILTTHNPAVLDGLNLDDEEQRLYTVSRTRSGQTKVKRIVKPTVFEGAPEIRLSEMFLRGLIGGLPKGF